jgi:hypothetical protein
MSTFVLGKVKGIMANALLNFAKKEGVQPENMQIVITADESGNPVYWLYKNFKSVKIKDQDGSETQKRLDFLEILNKNIDILGYESLSEPFMADTLQRMANECGSDIKNIRVMILTKDNEKAEPSLVLYNKDECVRQMFFETDIFQMTE